MSKDEVRDPGGTTPREAVRPQPKPVAEDTGVLDWGLTIEAPPRRSGTIRAKLEFAGRGLPFPVDGPPRSR